MRTKWTAIELLKSETAAASADLALLAGPPLVCHASQPVRERVLRVAGEVELAAERGSTLDLLLADDPLRRILILGIGGDTRSPAAADWLSIGGLLSEAMTKHRLPSVRLPVSAALGSAQAFEDLVLGALLRSFRLDTASGLERSGFVPRILMVAEEDISIAERARAAADVVNRARAWVEQPANVLTPRTWIEEAREVFGQSGAVLRVLGPAELQEIGANALVAVGRGSSDGAHLLIVEWRGDQRRDEWDAVMIGKGLTFDAGGLHLKPRPKIAKMKFDMAGGAAVLGAIELAIKRGSRANVVAIVPIAENVIDAMAFRPGDVLTSLAGLTIEVADTDAEGRLVLADAIAYAIRNYRPSSIVDVATLTAAAIAMLYEEFAALYSSDDRLAGELVQAGEAVGERLWRMPLDPSQDYLVESEVADVRNVGPQGLLGTAEGSAVAGAKFLERFARGVRWAHIDMTGPAWSTRVTSRRGKGATGYAVRLLDRWLSLLEAGDSCA